MNAILWKRSRRPSPGRVHPVALCDLEHESHVLVYIYIYIYAYIHTHTHTHTLMSRETNSSKFASSPWPRARIARPAELAKMLWGFPRLGSVRLVLWMPVHVHPSCFFTIHFHVGFETTHTITNYYEHECTWRKMDGRKQNIHKTSLTKPSLGNPQMFVICVMHVCVHLRFVFWACQVFELRCLCLSLNIPLRGRVKKRCAALPKSFSEAWAKVQLYIYVCIIYIYIYIERERAIVCICICICICMCICIYVYV